MNPSAINSDISIKLEHNGSLIQTIPPDWRTRGSGHSSTKEEILQKSRCSHHPFLFTRRKYNTEYCPPVLGRVLPQRHRRTLLHSVLGLPPLCCVFRWNVLGEATHQQTQCSSNTPILEKLPSARPNQRSEWDLPGLLLSSLPHSSHSFCDSGKYGNYLWNGPNKIHDSQQA